MSDIDKIKERLNIEDVVSSYIDLQRAGSTLKARCPFHNEKTPSFYISPDRGMYKCFGCGKSGDIFTFVQEFEGLDFSGALKLLADRAGVELSNNFQSLKKDDNDIIYEILEKTCSFFEDNLKKENSALQYLKARGLKDDYINNFRIGFAQNSWHTLLQFLESLGYKKPDIEKAGLIKSSNGKVYDRFRSRIIFPIFDPSSRVIAFSGRTFGDDSQKEEIAKYLNSPDTPVFNKSKTLYGFNFAKSEIRSKKEVIVVEGQMDLVLSHQEGFRNTVAVSGTALTKDHLVLLKRLAGKIILSYDGDNAGINAALRASKIILEEDLDPFVLYLENGLDPADFILKRGAEKWQEILNNKMHIIDFYIKHLREQNLNELDLLKQVKTTLLPLVSAIKSPLAKNHFLEKVSNALNISKDIILREVALIKVSFSGDETFANNFSFESTDPRKNALRKIAGLFFYSKDKKKEGLFTIDFINQFKEIEGEGVWNKIENLPEKVAGEVALEAGVLYDGEDNLNKQLQGLLNALLKLKVRAKIENAQNNLKQAEKDKNTVKIKKSLEDITNLTKQADNLNT